MKISLKMVYQYMVIFFNCSPTSNHLHPLQVENCDSNSRLVVDEDDNVKSGLKGLKANSWIAPKVGITYWMTINPYNAEIFLYKPWSLKIEIIINVLVSSLRSI